MFETPYFRCVVVPDADTVEICGALKVVVCWDVQLWTACACLVINMNTSLCSVECFFLSESTQQSLSCRCSCLVFSCSDSGAVVLNSGLCQEGVQKNHMLTVENTLSFGHQEPVTVSWNWHWVNHENFNENVNKNIKKSTTWESLFPCDDVLSVWCCWVSDLSVVSVTCLLCQWLVCWVSDLSVESVTCLLCQWLVCCVSDLSVESDFTVCHETHSFAVSLRASFTTN